ncbi:sensor histidine kinase [Nonlabens marinus]|uniref:histidine kinase n=1 Tax=Nonlabens marinus S1-08 TaxID=1454201 RepID=W8VRD2_9FLAO|nr:ATP-binding protein [Nonlabens marinus]BAO56174.1 phytochrome, two-component sensor histidine kinase [Nonlabens marinus S1-08]
MNNLLNIDILTKTFDDMPVGVGIFQVTDLDDIESIQYVFMNKVLLYEMRKTKEEVFGKKIMEVAPEAYAHEAGLYVIETYRKVAREHETINLGLVQYSNHMVAGTYECSVHHIQDNYVYVMLRNVTELEKAKNELEKKNKELSEFAYIASHDLKSPLSNISMLVKMIESDYGETLDEHAITFLKFINQSIGRMKNLITDLLEYSTVGNKKEVTQIDCQKLVETVEQDLESTIKETDAQIEIGTLPTLNGYETELSSLFQNLIINAIKFVKPGITPVISITAEKDNGWRFAVKDNGIGISTENPSEIFSIFKRLHTEKHYEGTGIGLAHCKKIVDLHEGKIWVESTPGEGSTFYFTIPQKESA